MLLPSTPLPIAHVLAAAALLAAGAWAQQVRAVPPVGALAPAASPTQGAPGVPDDPGVAVDLFENPNLDRYLRRAQQFLEREDYAQAIRVLQDVIDGRTSEVVVTGPEDEATPAAPPPPEPVPPLPTGRQAPKNPPKQPELDARNSVFSQDGRLYRPVRRLCHEMLARLPAIGLEIYRANHEAAADELLQAAVADGSLPALEQVANRYFVTLPAGKAMALLADRLMHEGRHRAAVLVLNDLVDVYPAELRRRLGISDVWCRFKVALCLRLAGEGDSAHAAVQALAAQHPDESLRVLGQLHAVKDLPGDALFARDVAAVAATQVAAAGASCLADPEQPLVPLWQFRFRNQDPYKEPKPSNNDRNVVFFDGGVTTAVMPFAGRYGPSTWVAFAGADANGLPQALFLEHFRLRVADATNGLLLAEGDGTDEPPTPRENQPRVRIAAVDQATLRPVDDGQRRYVLFGHPRASTNNADPLKASELVAYDAVSGKVAWRSTQWREGEGGLQDVTMLAAPTVFGERLLLPSLRRGKYALECLDRQTGRPVWNTQIHGGGTPFFKAPGCPVAVQAGMAFVATNAGCVASIDAFTGDLRWIRRYERVDPLRRIVKTRRPKANDEFAGMGYQGQFLQQELPGFHPSDLQLHAGLVIAAPCDSDMLLGLDGASGEVVWMLDGTTRYAGYGKLRGLVGLLGDDLFAVSDTHLVAIGAAGGLVKWARELPTWNGMKTAGRGRGTIAGDRVLIPGDREVLVYGADGTLRGRMPLPAFDASREPLAGSMNLVVNGPWLAVGYAGGVEMFSSAKALRQLADGVGDVRRKADLLVRAGDAEAAIGVLTAALRGAADPAEQRALGADLLGYARDRAYALARAGDAEPGLAWLDGFAGLLGEARVRLSWHLARVELCKDKGDLRAHEREQNRLYDYMEGKG